MDNAGGAAVRVLASANLEDFSIPAEQLDNGKSAMLLGIDDAEDARKC
jgi:hypothetical protein